MTKRIVSFVAAVSIAGLVGCSNNTDVASPREVQSEEEITAELNQEIGKIMEVYSQAISNPTDADIKNFSNALKEFDSKYNSNIASSFNRHNSKALSKSTLSGGNDFPALTNLPLQNDGDVYLSGGGTNAMGNILTWISPSATQGRYYHSACFDKNLFDPTNLDAMCFQTAHTKGAGYETAMDWMKKPNVSVLHFKGTLNSASLNQAQDNLSYYCNPSNTNQKYGFFKDYTNIFSVVTKEDNYYWYCTKVAWRIYSQLGINIDSDSPQINWASSGLYDLVVAYYKVKYWYSSSKANAAIASYTSNLRQTLVLADEVYYSPLFNNIFEVIRN